MKTNSTGKLRIGDVAKQLEVKEFVIRFWEREFNIKAKRSPGGQRFYTKQHLQLLSHIKDLLYKEEFTIAGAKKHLEMQKKSSHKIASSQSEPSVESPKLTITAAKLDTLAEGQTHTEQEERGSEYRALEQTAYAVILEQLSYCKQQLLKIREIL